MTLPLELLQTHFLGDYTLRYTDKEITVFCELAVDVGIKAAMNELEYPKYATVARRWMEARGLNDPDSLAVRDPKLYMRLSVEQQLEVVDRAIAKLYVMLDHIDDDDAKGMREWNNAIRTAVETRRLLEDKATSITENINIDAGGRFMLFQLMEQNKKREQELRGNALGAGTSNELDVIEAQVLDNVHMRGEESNAGRNEAI